MRGRGAFRAPLVLLLVLLVVAGSALCAAAVPPPENVSLSCHNVMVTVNWNYTEQQPETLFKVSISGTEGRFSETETIDHHYNLSHYVWKSQDHYLDYISVRVTAVQGGHRSEDVEGKSFTFNYLTQAETKCVLDFPPVDVDISQDGGKATVSFSNPIKFYRELEQTASGSEPMFKFSVSSFRNGTKDHGSFTGSCSAKDSICKAEVALSKGVKPCFKLENGFLYMNEGIYSVKFKDVDEVCAEDSVGIPEAVLAVILTVFVLFLIIMGVIVICKAKAWTMKTGPKPKCLEKTDPNPSLKYLCVESEDNKAISIAQDCKPLSEDLDDSQNCDNQSADSDESCSERSDYPEGSVSESSSQTYCGSTKTECLSVESGEEEVREESPYDCPHVLVLDMGDGDMVTGYDGK
ncbi:unnamed protein product [Ophioblennius macclurei]